MSEMAMTKSSSSHGGKRKGAGRPRFTQTGKTETFSTRLTPQTRDLLDAEAARRGESVSKTAEDLLVMALEEVAGLRQPRALKALLTLIEKLSGTFSEWDTNPYWYAAFRTAIVELVDALRPGGEIVKPDDDYPSAEDWGHFEMRDLFLEAERHAHTHARGKVPADHLRVIPGYMRFHYGMADAFKDLNLKSKRGK
jgi:hypothetical protein